MNNKFVQCSSQFIQSTMKLRPVIILLVTTFLTSTKNLHIIASQFDVDEKNDLLMAASEIIFKGFGASAVTINFILALSDETKVKHNRLIDNLIERCTSASATTRVELETMETSRSQLLLSSVYVEDVNFITQRQKLYNVIFIDTITSFHQLHVKINERNSNFVIDGYYLMIFVAERTIGELGEVTKKLWSLSIYNVLIIVPNERQKNLEDIVDIDRSTDSVESRLSLITFKPFALPSKCDDATPVTINIFTNGRFTTNQFFSSKMNKFSKCPIKVVSFNCAPMMMITYDEEERRHIEGIDGRMLRTLSEALDFSIDFIHFDDEIG